jgi:histidinol-phosphate/aromatic aminotransferase/cobyric acid decarboxylase-like protein
MQPYQDTEHLYETLQQLFEQLEQYNPRRAADFSRSRLIVQLNTTEPEGVVVLNGRTTPITTLFGPKKPDCALTWTSPWAQTPCTEFCWVNFL